MSESKESQPSSKPPRTADPRGTVRSTIGTIESSQRNKGSSDAVQEAKQILKDSKKK